MTGTDLRVGLVGAGKMGADHARRIHERVSNAKLVAIGDPDLDRAGAAASGIEGCRTHEQPAEVIASSDVDAVVLATPGATHEPLLLAAIERGIPVLCEKPLTPDSKSALRVLEAEQDRGAKLVQVGFMRRFDEEHAELKRLLDSGEFGRTLLLHCAHRNAASPPGFTDGMMITDSVVHEFDTARWLLEDEVAAVSVRRPRPAEAAGGLSDPQLVTVEMAGGAVAEVEIFVNCTFGYQVRCEAVCEKGTALLGGNTGLLRHTGGGWGGEVTVDFRDRFLQAFDLEFQRWVHAARRGGIDGPGAWDGYAAAAVAEAGVAAQDSGCRTPVDMIERPASHAQAPASPALLGRAKS